MPAMPGGLGALVTTEVEDVDLGRFGDRTLRGRVVHRRLRVAAGRRRGFALTLGRLRPVSVEVTEPGGSYEVPIPHVESPQARALQGLALLWAASLLLRWWARRWRSRRATLEGA